MIVHLLPHRRVYSYQSGTCVHSRQKEKQESPGVLPVKVVNKEVEKTPFPDK